MTCLSLDFWGSHTYLGPVMEKITGGVGDFLQTSTLPWRTLQAGGRSWSTRNDTVECFTFSLDFFTSQWTSHIHLNLVTSQGLQHWVFLYVGGGQLTAELFNFNLPCKSVTCHWLMVGAWVVVTAPDKLLYSDSATLLIVTGWKTDNNTTGE